MNLPLVFAFLLMGFTSLVAQTLLIREFLVTFYGNELVIGIILANWLVLEGIGSGLFAGFSGKAKRPLFFYLFLQIAIALYFPLSIVLIRISKNVFTVSFGEIVGLFPVFLSSFLIIAPLSLLDGIEYPFACRLYRDIKQNPLESAGKVYILEALGFIIAGPVFIYLLLIHLPSTQIALIVAFLNLLSAFFLFTASEKKTLAAGFFLVFLLGLNIYFLFSNFAGQIEKMSIQRQWQGRELVSEENSLYGRLSVIKSGEQYTFYSNGIPIVTVPYPDTIWNEELVHFALLTHPEPRNVLLISGGAGGVLKEILKYPLKNIDYTELDPALIKLIKKYPTPLTTKELSDPRVNLIHLDGRRFIQQQLSSNSRTNYDLVLLNLPPPITLQLNRFYTVEFFRSIKKIVGPGGVFVFSLPGSLSALSRELVNLNGSIINSLEEVFPNVEIIPGENNLFLASAGPVEVSAKKLQEALKKHKLHTKMLTPAYLAWRLDEKWFNWFNQAMGNFASVKKNYDLSPKGLFYQLVYWNALSSPRFNRIFRYFEKINLFLIVLLVFFLSIIFFFLIKAKPAYKKFIPLYAIMTTGFLGMTFELILVFVYQSFYGYVYHYLALLITAFMAGLTAGGWLMTRRLGRIANDIVLFRKLEIIVIIFSLVVIPLLILLKGSGNEFASIFFVLAGIIGFLVGLEFPLVNKICQKRELESSAGMIYASDLFGACLAAIIVSVGLIPLIGVIPTLLVLVLVKISSLTFIRFC